MPVHEGNEPTHVINQVSLHVHSVRTAANPRSDKYKILRSSYRMRNNRSASCGPWYKKAVHQNWTHLS